jgi:hypothetical protein
MRQAPEMLLAQPPRDSSRRRERQRSSYAKASGLKTLFKPRVMCFLIGTKPVNLGIRPSNLAYGTSFARGKTGTTLPKRSNLGHLKNVVKERML